MCKWKYFLLQIEIKRWEWGCIILVIHVLRLRLQGNINSTIACKFGQNLVRRRLQESMDMFVLSLENAALPGQISHAKNSGKVGRYKFIFPLQTMWVSLENCSFIYLKVVKSFIYTCNYNLNIWKQEFSRV